MFSTHSKHTFMYKFEKRLKELDATEDQVSKKLKALIAEFREHKDRNDPEIDEAGWEQWENDLVVEVDKWNKNKGKVEKMLAGREAAKNKPAPPPVEPIPVVVEPVEPVEPPAPPPEPIPEPAAVTPPVEEEKGSGIGTFVGVIFAGICLAVGINYFKNR